MNLLSDIDVLCNFHAQMRCRGKLVPSSVRDGHNVFTVTGRNLLARLLSWQTIGGTDIPYTNRRVRWMGVGIGSQLEVSTVSSLAQAQLGDAINYLLPVQATEFPTTTSARFIREFGANEITISNTPVVVTEAGMFADVLPASAGGVDDVAVDPGNVDTVLDPSVGTNPPIAYKVFEPLTKTVDFTLEIRWDIRFG
jgi:hypothetical protein